MGKKPKAGFLGAGKMGNILIEGVVKSGIADAGSILLYEQVAERAKEVSSRLGVKAVESAGEVIEGSDLVFICVKPDQFKNLAGDIREKWAGNRPCIVTIMAGVKTARVRELISGEANVIRVMPNVACTVRRGIAGIARDYGAPEEMNEFVYSLFEELGGAVWVPEEKMDAVTAMSGSGPAYVFMFLEAFTDAGVKIGLDRATSEKLAVRTVAGAAAMLEESGFDTLQLRAQVSSPGGTTVAGTRALEKKGLRSAIMEAVEAAWKRSIELGG